MRALVLMLVLSGGTVRAQDGGVPAEEGLVLEVRSGTVELATGAIRAIGPSLVLDELAAVRSARELEALRAEVKAWRTQPKAPPPPAVTPLGITLATVGGLLAGLVAGFFLFFPR
ncbi:MAG: hypothetical protein JNJ54_34975 [Myxococcaceae bacterium]|nr:hypothetical protein [Myxococcaceae bacterium]